MWLHKMWKIVASTQAKKKRGREGEREQRFTFMSQRQNISFKFSLSFSFAFHVSCFCFYRSPGSSFACFALAALHRLLPHTKQTHLLHCFLRNFFFFFYILRPFNWKIGTVRRLACKATILTFFFHSFFVLFSYLFLLVFSAFSAFCLLLFLLPLSVGHAPDTLHWPWPWTPPFSSLLLPPPPPPLAGLSAYAAPQISFIFAKYPVVQLV